MPLSNVRSRSIQMWENYTTKHLHWVSGWRFQPGCFLGRWRYRWAGKTQGCCHWCLSPPPAVWWWPCEGPPLHLTPPRSDRTGSESLGPAERQWRCCPWRLWWTETQRRANGTGPDRWARHQDRWPENRDMHSWICYLYSIIQQF